MEIRNIAHGRRIEHHQIRPVSFTNLASFLQAKPRRRQTGHLVHRRVQRKQSDVTTEMSEHPWESAPQAWMRERIFRQSVRAHHRQRMREDSSYIRLVHAVVHRARRLQAFGGVEQRQFPFGGDVDQVATADLRVRRRPGDGDAVGVGDLFQIQRRGTRRIRIAIAADRMGFRCLFQRREQLRTAPPVADTGTLEVGNDHW